MVADKMVKSDKCMGVSQLLGVRARAAPKVYVYIYMCKCKSPKTSQRPQSHVRETSLLTGAIPNQVCKTRLE